MVSEAVVSRYLNKYGRKASVQSQYAAIIAKRRQPIIQLFLQMKGQKDMRKIEDMYENIFKKNLVFRKYLPFRFVFLNQKQTICRYKLICFAYFLINLTYGDSLESHHRDDSNGQPQHICFLRQVVAYC